MKTNKWIAFALLLLLLGASFYKDDFTPDYRNTPAASFLSPNDLADSRLTTLSTHTSFWVKSLLYSIVFIVIPFLVIRFAFASPELNRFTLVLHLVLMVLLYSAIFLNMNKVDIVVVSKVNRYLHSPIITLFLWAAFTLTTKHQQPDEKNI